MAENGEIAGRRSYSSIQPVSSKKKMAKKTEPKPWLERSGFMWLLANAESGWRHLAMKKKSYLGG